MQALNEYPYIDELLAVSSKKNINVFLVGGFLRDYLLGETDNTDFDFAADKNALSLAQAFAKKIKGAYILLDKEHGCARVAKKRNGKIYTYDFADFRASSLKEDLKLRDFSINTFVADISLQSIQKPLKDCIKDHKNAFKDLKAKRIKRTSIKAFKDDPLRMMRAFSLQAQLGFRIELATLNQIRKEKEKILSVSFERVRDELFKILETENAGNVLKLMDKTGILEYVIPQVRVMYNCEQGAYHHLDVWAHSLQCISEFDRLIYELRTDDKICSYLNETIASDRSRKALIRLALLLHDIGKPETRKKENGKYSFHGHERAGRTIVKEIAKKLKLSTHERYTLENMVFFHLRPGYLSNFKSPSEKSIYRYFRDTKEEAASIALLSIADQRATRGPLTTADDQKHHYKICMDLISEHFKIKEKEPFVCLLNGHDLIKNLSLKPSALFKKILEQVAEAQILGNLKTKEEALSFAKQIAEKEHLDEN